VIHSKNPLSLNSPHPRSAPPARAAAALVVLAVALLLSACGSGGSSTITVGNENKADNALIKSSETAAEKSTESSTTNNAAIHTPTSGPLSKKPVVTIPPGATPTVLIKKDLIVGTGPEAKAGQPVTVNYVGVLYKGGTEFDSSWKRSEPFPFTLGKGQVIAGWDQGVAGMKVGGRRELIIPAALAYKSVSRPGIPANSALVFVVDLLAV